MKYYTTAVLIWLSLLKCHSCEDINNFFEEINDNTKKFNSLAADVAWQASLESDKDGLAEKAAEYQMRRTRWQHGACRTLSALQHTRPPNSTQDRMGYLLCRGPIYYYEEARKMSKIYEDLQSMYSNMEVCVPDSQLTTSLTDKEGAILNYLSHVKYYLNMEHLEHSHVKYAAKMAANGDVQNGLTCFKGEDEFERLMEFSRKPDVLEWVWSAWRERAMYMRGPYESLVALENKAARRNGYKDIGECWREELELPGVRAIARRLYDSVKPLYQILHGVVRFLLRRAYGGDAVEERGPIPAHLLGNLWSHSWESLGKFILPVDIDLDARIANHHWTVNDVVKHAVDFYVSLGLPPMTESFWRESVYSRGDNELARCHGSAADMFQDGDFRLLYCSGVTFQDFYVIHHELGHIQYYMAYEKQPALFRQANAALHESIGDTIMYAVMTPQHLHRLRLINDSELYTSNTDYIETAKEEMYSNKKENKENLENFKINTVKGNKVITTGYLEKAIKKLKATTNNTATGIEKVKGFGGTKKNKDHTRFEAKMKTNLNNNEYYDNFKINNNNNEFIQINYKAKLDDIHEALKGLSTDDILLLQQALNKLPQIPFSLLMDEYRWRYFEGTLDKESLNQAFWDMVRDLQGIAPPDYRGEEYFDIAAKFHVPDNTPYIRYFLSSFLQHQLFETLCKAAILGRRNMEHSLPDTISLNRCDIYGSKVAGKILKDIMSRGASQSWQQILRETTGRFDISADALMRYYRPLYGLLMKLVDRYEIPIGW